MADLNVASKCWICEGWSSFDFKLSSQKVKAEAKTTGKVKVFLHMSFDGFKGHQMEQVDEDYVCSQMVPPGTLEYYYTV